MATPSIIVDGLCVVSTLDGMSVQVSWEPLGTTILDGNSGFDIYRSPVPHNSPTDYFTQLNSSIWEGLTYYDKVAIPPEGHGQYWYKVTVENADGEGSQSEPVSTFPYSSFDNVPLFSTSIENLITKE